MLQPSCSLRAPCAMLGVLLVLSACSGTDSLPDPTRQEDPSTGIPVLDPLPLAPDGDLVRFTIPESTWQDIDIVGLPGAVAQAGEVTIDSAEQSVTVMSTAQGSFVASVPGSAGDTVSLRFETSASTQIVIEGIAPPGPLPSRVDSPPKVVDGFVTTSIEAPLGATVVVVNPNNGAVVIAVAEASDLGAWATFRIAAEPGDILRAYVDGPPLSAPIMFRVG